LLNDAVRDTWKEVEVENAKELKLVTGEVWVGEGDMQLLAGYGLTCCLIRRAH
jgi:hypothetical protein